MTTIAHQTYLRIKEYPELAKTEYWVELPAELKLSKYLISTFGNLYSKHLKMPMMINPRASGYREVRLVDDNHEAISTRMSRLMAITFIPNPDNKETVDHISLFRSDDSVLNLGWATRSEQGMNRVSPPNRGTARRIIQKSLDGVIIKHWDSIKDAIGSLNRNKNNKGGLISRACIKGSSAYGYLWDYELDGDFADEVWRPIPGFDDIFASSLGRIRRSDGILVSSHFNGGYEVISIRGNVKKRVHHLVCLSFHGVPPNDGKVYIANHKNGNKLDNTPENLEWLTYSGNALHAHQNGLVNSRNKHTKAVLQYGLDGTLIAEFSSCTEAVNMTGVSHVSSACNGGNHKAGNYIWKWKHDYSHIVPLTSPPAIPM